MTPEQQTILNFLLGSNDIDGVWFGDEHPTERGQFWWRSRLQEAFLETKEPVQKPVAWMVYSLDGKSACVTDNPSDFTSKHRALPLYTSPPQRKPLTLPQIHELNWPDDVAFEDILEFTRAVEAAHGITGEGT